MLSVAPSMRPRLELASKAFLVTSFLGVLVAGVLRLTAKAEAAREHRVELGRWSVLERPSWSKLDDVRAVRSASGLAAYHASWFDPNLASVSQRLSLSPDVRRVAEVRRAWPNGLQAVLELRRPVVAVRGSGARESYVEADEDGVALSAPVSVRPIRDGRPLRVVTGSTASPPAPGGRFGPDVQAAAWLSSSLDAHGDAATEQSLALLDRIDVANYGGRQHPGASEVLLACLPQGQEAAAAGTKSADAKTPACVVEWGRAGDRDAAGRELPFDAKARHLCRALRLFPRLEGLKVVRVAFADLVVVPDASPPARLARALGNDPAAQAK